MGYGKSIELVVKFKDIEIMDPVAATRRARWAQEFQREQLVRRLVQKLEELGAIAHYIDDVCHQIRIENKDKMASQLEDLITNYKTQDQEGVQLVARSTQIENNLRNHVPTVDVIFGKSMAQLIMQYYTKARRTCTRCKEN